MKKTFTLFCIVISSVMLSQNPTWVLFDHTNAPFTDDYITCVKVDSNNAKWVGTHNGLFKFHNNSWTEYNMSNSNIPTNDISPFEIAYDNTIWFPNNGNGFYKFQNNTFALYDQTNLPALSTQDFKGLTLDSNDVFLWSDTSGIVKFNALTNAVYNINTSNSCIKAVKKLVAHGNHMIYGVALNPTVQAMPPQNQGDSIMQLSDFKITNTSTSGIAYCFADLYTDCNYADVFADRYGHRFELFFDFTGMGFDQYLRTYDATNTLLNDIPYTQHPEYQFAKNAHGFYRLQMGTSSVYHLNINLFNPPSSHIYHAINSIIPIGFIENFDIDTLNTVWLATAGGLVGYNDMGVITNLDAKNTGGISLYPNPASNELSFMSSKAEACEITIYDINGRLMSNFFIKEDQFPKTISLESFDSGIYFYKVVSGNKTLQNKLVIIKI